MGPLLVILVTVLIVLPLMLSIGWVLAQYAIERTSGVEFCTTCHSMDPMGESYRLDVHGGRSLHGIQASCSDCHLPHDSPLNFIGAYWMRLVGDTWVELLVGSDTPDWDSIRDNRESYVFDSGCLGCHAKLLDAFPRNTDAFAAHKAYFSENNQETCVSCHTSVGHKDLGTFLTKNN